MTARQLLSATTPRAMSSKDHVSALRVGDGASRGVLVSARPTDSARGSGCREVRANSSRCVARMRRPCTGSHASMRSSLTPAATAPAVTSPLPQEVEFGRRCRVGRRARTGRAARAPRGRAPRERPRRAGWCTCSPRRRKIRWRRPCAPRTRCARLRVGGGWDIRGRGASVEETGSLRDGGTPSRRTSFRGTSRAPATPCDGLRRILSPPRPSTRATGVPRAPPRVHRAVRPMKNATGAQLTLLSSAKIPVARFRARRASSIVRTSFSTTNRRDASHPHPCSS